MYRAGAWVFTLFSIFFPCWWEPREGSNNQSHHGLICPAGVSHPTVHLIHFSAHAKKLLKLTLRCARCGQRLPDTSQDLPSGEFSCPTTHPEQPSRQNKAECLQKWFRSEQMLHMFYHPGNSETFQEWSYGSPASQGAAMHCLSQTTRPQCQSNKTKGREGGGERHPENLQDTGYKQVAEY